MIKNFNDFNKANEELNLKSIAAGALMTLATACNQATINGVESENYEGDLLVRKIEISGGKYNFFKVHGKDSEGKDVKFSTNELTFNVGDSIHVDFKKQEAYPLKDKDNNSTIDNYR